MIAQQEDFPEETIPLGTGSPAEFGEMNPEWTKDFDGLLYIGQLTSKFEFLHHSIVIRTLNSDEHLIVGQLVAEWDATIAGTRAYAIAMVALALEFIDGQPLPSPLGEGKEVIKWARERFNWTRRLYPYTIDAIYDRYSELEGRVARTLSELGKDSGQVDATPGWSGNSGSPADAGS